MDINTTTGVFTPVVAGNISFTDIALSETNQLYGVAFSGLYSLYNIDQITNTSTLIGNTGTTLNALGFDNTNQLYASGENQLSTINTTTGNATVVNNLSDYSSAGDIVFDPVNNRFLGTSSTPVNSTLFSINPINGVATQIGSIGFGDVVGLFFENGPLFGYTYARQQIIINPTTGAGTFDKLVTGGSGNIFGAASLPSTGPDPQPTPEPSTMLGLLAMSGIELSQLKRRKGK